MKAKLLLALIVAIAGVSFGPSSPAQDPPDQFAVSDACGTANFVIPELMELAPYGTGRLNRTISWFENLFEIIKDLLFWIFDIRWNGELSQVAKAVGRVDVAHDILLFQLMTIMNADFQAVEYVMPSKLQSPADYIAGVKLIEKMFVDPGCRPFLR